MSDVDQAVNLALVKLLGPQAKEIVQEIVREVVRELGLREHPDARSEPLIKMDQLACQLGINSETGYRWIRTYPDFPVVKIGGLNGGKHPVYRFRLSEVVDWLRRNGRVTK